MLRLIGIILDEVIDNEKIFYNLSEFLKNIKGLPNLFCIIKILMMLL